MSIHNSTCVYMPEGYVPINTDVLCGRGKACVMHSGNKIFMDVIRSNLSQYTAAETRIDRSIIVRGLLNTFLDSGIRFLKLDKTCQRYFELSRDLAHSKVGHSIRDAIRTGSKGKAHVSSQVAKSDKTGTSQKRTKKRNSSSRCIKPTKVEKDLFSISDNSNVIMGDSICNDLPLPINSMEDQFELEDIEKITSTLLRYRSTSTDSSSSSDSIAVNSSVLHTVADEGENQEVHDVEKTFVGSKSSAFMKELIRSQKEIFEKLLEYDSTKTSPPPGK